MVKKKKVKTKRRVDSLKCPKCGKEYTKLLALSRKDNKTMICDSCGMQEAFEDYFNAETNNDSNKGGKEYVNG